MEVSMFASRSQKLDRDQPRRTFAQSGSAPRRVALLAMIGVLPIAAALSQGGVVAQASLPATATGAWAMLQVSKTTALTYFTPTINAALATPGVKGLSLRAPWTAITSNLDIFTQGVHIAQADHSQLAIRFIAGVDTPAQFIGNSVTIAGKAAPLPWGQGSTPTSFVPNTVFENAYRATVQQLAAFALANGVHVLHLSWYSGTSAEIYNGPEVVNAPGYSLQNFLTGYERLAVIGESVAGPNLSVEFPFSGVGTRPVVTPLESFMATTFGSFNPAVMAQWNNLTDRLPAAVPPANGVNVSRQMMGQGDFNWTNVFSTLHAQHTQMVEIYLQSFSPSFAHAALLRQYVATFPN
jgi:hypothetical protein